MPAIFPSKVDDAELAAWLERGTGTRELIFEADLPARTVTLGPGGRFPIAITAPGGDRGELLETLLQAIAPGLTRAPVLLKAAGAIAAEVDRAGARKILEHPLVKAVRPNRRPVRRAA